MGLPAQRTPGDQRDEGDIVLGWLVRVTVGLVVLGVCLFDAISVAITHLRSSDDAASVANAASEAWQRGGSHDLQASYDTAEQLAASRGEQVPTTSFRVDPDGTVHLRLRSTASTVVLHRLRPVARLAKVEVAASGRALLS